SAFKRFRRLEPLLLRRLNSTFELRLLLRKLRELIGLAGRVNGGIGKALLDLLQPATVFVHVALESRQTISIRLLARSPLRGFTTSITICRCASRRIVLPRRRRRWAVLRRSAFSLLRYQPSPVVLQVAVEQRNLTV